MKGGVLLAEALQIQDKTVIVFEGHCSFEKACQVCMFLHIFYLCSCYT